VVRKKDVLEVPMQIETPIATALIKMTPKNSK